MTFIWRRIIWELHCPPPRCQPALPRPREVPHKELTLVEEEAKEVSQEEDGAGASGSDISVDSELDYFIP